MNTRVITKSGLQGWQGRLRDQYDSFNEFVAFADMYGLAQRLGFETAREAWNVNPMVQGSTHPDDYCRVFPRIDKGNNLV